MSDPIKGHYYVPSPSYRPIIASIGLFLMAIGVGSWIHQQLWGAWSLLTGALIIIVVMFSWFGAVIKESLSGHYNAQVDRSFRWGMVWFIFSEVCFFGVFFGVLFYARVIILPYLGGDYGTHASTMTKVLLWPNFVHQWPLFKPPAMHLYPGMQSVINAWGIPALNTAILLSSGVTITIAHWALVKNQPKRLMWGMAATLILGVVFLGFQAYEYWNAYALKALTLQSGIYGATFFMLTGFHGLHVAIGVIMLMVILIRCAKGHFNVQHHFAFEAVSWYWHFVDIVWLGVFVFVYWL